MFSILTSKIFGGASIALALALVWVTLTKNGEIGDLKESVKSEQDANDVLRLDNATLRSNGMALEGGLNQCNASVVALNAKVEAVNKAGAMAVEAAQRSRSAVERKLGNIDKLPSTTCEDALAILKSGGSE